MAASETGYPWFAVASGDEVEQGDILENCPVFFPPDDIVVASGQPFTAELTVEDRDVIVLSQSCDLVKGREKIDDVLLCAVWKREEMPKEWGEPQMEEARKGRLPAFHLLAECTA